MQPQVPPRNTVAFVADDGDFCKRLDAAGDKLVVVDIGQSSSASRERMLSVMLEGAEKNQAVVFLRLDVNKCPETRKMLDVDEEEVMTFVFLKNKEIVAKFSGPGKNVFKRYLEACKSGDPERIEKLSTHDADGHSDYDKEKFKQYVAAYNSKVPAAEGQSALHGADDELPADNVIYVANDFICRRKLCENRNRLVVMLVYDPKIDRCNSACSYVREHAKVNKDVLYLFVNVTKCPFTLKSYYVTKVPQVVFRKKKFGWDQLFNFDSRLFEKYVAKYKPESAVLPQQPFVNTVQLVADDNDFAEKLRGAQGKLVVVDIGGDPSSVYREVRMFSLEQDLALENPDVVFLKIDKGKCPQAVIDYGIDEANIFTISIRKNGDELKRLVGDDVEKLDASLIQAYKE